MAGTMKSFQSNSTKACDEQINILVEKTEKVFLLTLSNYSNFQQKMSNHRTMLLSGPWS